MGMTKWACEGCSNSGRVAGGKPRKAVRRRFGGSWRACFCQNGRWGGTNAGVASNPPKDFSEFLIHRGVLKAARHPDRVNSSWSHANPTISVPDKALLLPAGSFPHKPPPPNAATALPVWISDSTNRPESGPAACKPARRSAPVDAGRKPAMPQNPEPPRDRGFRHNETGAAARPPPPARRKVHAAPKRT